MNIGSYRRQLIHYGSVARYTVERKTGEINLDFHGGEDAALAGDQALPSIPTASDKYIINRRILCLANNQS